MAWYWRSVWTDTMVTVWQPVPDAEELVDVLAWLHAECDISDIGVDDLRPGYTFNPNIYSLYPGAKPEYQFLEKRP